VSEPYRPRWAGLFALALVVAQLPGLSRSAFDPNQSDFANYFVPAFVLARGGDVGALYQRDVFEESVRLAGLSTLGSFVPHPPANALWLLPFAGLSPSTAKGLWTLTLLATLVCTIVMVRRLCPEASPALAALLVLAPTLSVRNNLAFGQPYPILGAFLLAGVLSLRSRHHFTGGFLLGLGAGLKPYALPIGALFLHPERLRALAGFACGVATPALILVGITGAGPLLEFGAKVLPWMVRGDIQDPFAAGWGSVGALANRLFRFEPDLNPVPWANLPSVARFFGAAVPSALLALGVWCGVRALKQQRIQDAVALVVALALAASPFVASYHLVLLVLPVAAVAQRLTGISLVLWLLAWAALGSPLMTVFRSVDGVLAPLAFARFFALLALSLVVAWPWLSRSMLVPVTVVGALVGLGAVARPFHEENWPRVETARGYSMIRPHFCGESLRWWSPSSDGRRMESRGKGEACEVSRRRKTQGPEVRSRFTYGSWNLFIRSAEGALERRITFSDANELDPVLSPDGCAVVFASDQGRGLGSTALYRVDLSPLIAGCGTDRSASSPP
jgi:hypothetical protein